MRRGRWARVKHGLFSFAVFYETVVKEGVCHSSTYVSAETRIWWPGEERRFMQAAVTEREAAEARRAGVVGVYASHVLGASHTRDRVCGSAPYLSEVGFSLFLVPAVRRGVR